MSRAVGRVLVVCAALSDSQDTSAQQVIDSTYQPRVSSATYVSGAGPTVRIDASHNNPTIDGALLPLRRLLEVDGYSVEELVGGIDTESLVGVDVLVVVDALADRNVNDWVLPVPSAFGLDVRRTVVDWVRSGGALLLAADHMPFAGAWSGLAADLGIEVLNGFAIDTVAWDPITFRRADRTLRAHSIVAGGSAAERIDSVFTYWGHAFRARSPDSEPLFMFAEGTVSLQPDEAWRFDDYTEVVEVGGWTQGITLSVGTGRVVVLGDSGMLMAHLVGLNAPEASRPQRTGGGAERTLPTQRLPLAQRPAPLG